MFEFIGWVFHRDADFAAAVATWGAVVLAFIAAVETYRSRLRNEVTVALRDFTNQGLAEARDRVGTAAHEVKVRRSHVSQVRHDIFSLIWAVERLVLVRRTASTALATDETAALYAHVTTVVETVNKVLPLMPDKARFGASILRANLVLDSLPAAKTSLNRTRSKAPVVRFHL